jgi:hypothetical protein
VSMSEANLGCDPVSRGRTGQGMIHRQPPLQTFRSRKREKRADVDISSPRTTARCSGSLVRTGRETTTLLTIATLLQGDTAR